MYAAERKLYRRNGSDGKARNVEKCREVQDISIEKLTREYKEDWCGYDLFGKSERKVVNDQKEYPELCIHFGGIMLTTNRERRICKKYSAYDKTGHVHCNECPLQKRKLGTI